MFRRLRARLDRLESDAHETMGGAQELIDLMKALIDDLADGISIQLVIAGKTIPIEIRIDPREDDPKT